MTTTMLAGSQIRGLRSLLRGDLIEPGQPGYEKARRVHNGLIDKRPALIARCLSATDVIAAVNFGREHNLALAVRGGGHHGAGLGTCDGGLVIDLAGMRGIRVDPARGQVRVEGGCTWGDVDHATHPFGLAVPAGWPSTTGVGGLTLGGGLGYLTRRYGLTIDNLLGVDLVLADGRFVTASSDENEDLFWAVRGGGGSFGVVTSFLFRGCPVSTVYGGPIFWPMARAGTILRFWRDLMLSGPEDLNGWFGFQTVPPTDRFPQALHLEQMAVIVWCYTGDVNKAEAVFRPIRAVARPALDLAGPVPYPALQSMFDELYPSGWHWHWQSDFFIDLSQAAIDLHLQHAAQLPTVHSLAHLYPVNGAAQRVGPGDSAWSFREANFVQVIAGLDPDPALVEQLRDWVEGYGWALRPYSAGGGYVNMMMDGAEANVKAAYRDNYTRLAAIKARYDPHNLFRVNHNIRPAQ
jgi:FAD/FMN-containing dehydrogenase